MSTMKSEQGAISPLTFSLISSVVLLVISLGFGVWAYMERQEYKKNSDAKVAAAVEVAKKQTASEKDNEFLEKEKNPYSEYRGSADFGSVFFKYPKTWSGYALKNDRETKLAFHPKLVEDGRGEIYALRVNIVSKKYTDTIREYDRFIKDGQAKAKVFNLNSLPNVAGVRVDGQIGDGIRGAVIIMPIRDKTLKISTEHEEYLKDLDGIILPEFNFSP